MTREQNRTRMPAVAAFVDAMRDAFGADQVKVIYASENGLTFGKPAPTGVPASVETATPTRTQGVKRRDRH